MKAPKSQPPPTPQSPSLLIVSSLILIHQEVLNTPLPSQKTSPALLPLTSLSLAPQLAGARELLKDRAVITQSP